MNRPGRLVQGAFSENAGCGGTRGSTHARNRTPMENPQTVLGYGSVSKSDFGE